MEADKSIGKTAEGKAPIAALLRDSMDATARVKGNYQQFTLETLAVWEKAAKDDPKAEWNYNNILELLPFMRKAMPRIGNNQSMFGLSLISLKGEYKDAELERTVRYGLEPLVGSGIVTREDGEAAVAWFLSTKPGWDSNNRTRFEKRFEIDGQKYKLMTDCYRNCRDLNLQAVKPAKRK